MDHNFDFFLILARIDSRRVAILMSDGNTEDDCTLYYDCP